MVKQLLPIGNLTMFEYEFQSDVFKEQVLGRTKESRQTLLLVFGNKGVGGNVQFSAVLRTRRPLCS